MRQGETMKYRFTKQQLASKISNVECDMIVMENRIASIEEKLLEILKPKKTVKKAEPKVKTEKTVAKKTKNEK